MTRPELIAALDTATKAANWPAVAKLAAELRLRFPQAEAGHKSGVAAARMLQLPDQARAILDAAREASAGKPWVLVEGARLAADDGDHEAAARLAADLREAFPDRAVGYQIGIAAARQIGDGDLAAALAEAAAERFPEASWPLVEHASAAVSAGDDEAALWLAALLRQRFPDSPAGHRIAVQVLRDAERLEEVFALLVEAKALFPGEAWPPLPDIEAVRSRAEREPALGLAAAMQAHAGSLWQAPACRRRVVVVLGMHRAGTSVCTRLVQHLGVSLGGPLLSADAANPDGYQEHGVIVSWQEALLREAGLQWNTPRLIRPIPPAFWTSPVTAGLETQLAQLVERQMEEAAGLATPATWGFKDPRTIQFIPLWQSIFRRLEIDPVWILAVRDPRAVAASLGKRDGMPLALGELLWLEHYFDAIRTLGPALACVVHYERWFAAPLGQIRAMAAAIGCASEAAIDTAAASIRLDLRHNLPDSKPCSLRLAQDFHEALQEESLNLAALQRRCDAVWRNLQARAKPFAIIPLERHTLRVT